MTDLEAQENYRREIDELMEPVKIIERQSVRIAELERALEDIAGLLDRGENAYEIAHEVLGKDTT